MRRRAGRWCSTVCKVQERTRSRDSVSAHLGTEVYNGERDDEYYARRAPRLSPTRYNDPRWKHLDQPMCLA